MRLNKYLSDAGVCSRREADRLTEAGEITVNGKRAETGMQVESGDVVVVKGKTVVPEEKKSISPSTNRAASSVLRKNGKKQRHRLSVLPGADLPGGKTRQRFRRPPSDDERRCDRKRYHACQKPPRKRIPGRGKQRDYTGISEKMASGVPILDTVTRPCRIRKTESAALRLF